MTCAVCDELTEGLMCQGHLESQAWQRVLISLQGAQVEGGNVLDDAD